MSRLILGTVEKTEERSRYIILGKVIDVKNGIGEYEDKLVNVFVSGHVWNPDKKVEETVVWDVAFWNTDMSQMADRAKKAKIVPGVTIMLDVTEKGGKYYANNFRYKGEFVIPATADHNERHFFMGTVTSFFDNGNRVNVSIPIENRNGETEWKAVAFWEPTEEGRTNLADRARKCLANKPHAVLITSDAKPYTSQNGEERVSYNGYDFVLY